MSASEVSEFPRPPEKASDEVVLSPTEYLQHLQECRPGFVHVRACDGDECDLRERELDNSCFIHKRALPSFIELFVDCFRAQSPQ